MIDRLALGSVARQAVAAGQVAEGAGDHHAARTFEIPARRESCDGQQGAVVEADGVGLGRSSGAGKPVLGDPKLIANADPQAGSPVDREGARGFEGEPLTAAIGALDEQVARVECLDDFRSLTGRKRIATPDELDELTGPVIRGKGLLRRGEVQVDQAFDVMLVAGKNAYGAQLFADGLHDPVAFGVGWRNRQDLLALRHQLRVVASELFVTRGRIGDLAPSPEFAQPTASAFDITRRKRFDDLAVGRQALASHDAKLSGHQPRVLFEDAQGIAAFNGRVLGRVACQDHAATQTLGQLENPVHGRHGKQTCLVDPKDLAGSAGLEARVGQQLFDRLR